MYILNNHAVCWLLTLATIFFFYNVIIRPKALFSGKVTVVDTYPNVLIRAVNINVPLPSVIAFRDYSPRQIYNDKAKKQHRRPPFSRRNVYLRDGFKCQYCNNMFAVHELSIDHVHPRCKGGRLCWYVPFCVFFFVGFHFVVVHNNNTLRLDS